MFSSNLQNNSLVQALAVSFHKGAENQAKFGSAKDTKRELTMLYLNKKKMEEEQQRMQGSDKGHLA